VRFVRWWTASPTIVAESLLGVPDALLTALHPGRPASGVAVAAAMALSMAPRELAVEPPSWLLPEQGKSFRRVLAAIERYRGAVLADPVGSGKTFVALAVAARLNRGPTACLVPAMLLAQWQRTAARLAIPVTLCSHEQVSRGHLPEGPRGLVVIDESHHFRNPHTKRYRRLAPWLVGRPALLVTATPIVNSMRDLAHQLLLTVKDDALAPHGIPSLHSMLAGGCAAEALGQLVQENERVTDGRPLRRVRRSLPDEMESAATLHFVELLSQLRFSRNEAIAGLIRGVLLRAVASSPAALEGALRRYRRLLLCARDAAQAGQPMDRAEVRRFTREMGDQLVWWELLPGNGTLGEIELDDIPHLEKQIPEVAAALQRPDGKLDRLEHLLEENTPTLVFTAFRDTVRYLRDRLAHLRLAWCTGERAGIGHTILARDAVLGWFRGAPGASAAPKHLIVTDVAAEGLDLQRAARVAHYDLPWTPMRMEQREGRSVRYGSQHAQVEVIRFGLPPILERQLKLERVLARKARIPAAAGLGPDGGHIWRWRAELADRFGSAPAQSGVAAIDSSTPGLLAGFALHHQESPGALASTILWLAEDGSWSEAPAEVSHRLSLAAEQQEVVVVDPALLREWLARLARPLRERLTLIRSRRWISPDPSSTTRQAMSTVQSLIGDAARRREATRLTELEGALAFLASGHTAGEKTIVERLAQASPRELRELIRRLPGRPFRWDGLEIRLTGLVVFRPAQGSPSPLASASAETPDRVVRSRRNPDRLDQADSRQLSPHAHAAQSARSNR
jgi:Helicase conserved C-terminal domain